MKRHELIFGFLRVPIDFFIVFGSFFLAKKIRLATDLIPSISLPIQTIDTELLMYYAFFGGLLYILLFSLHKLYYIGVTNSKIQEFLDIIRYTIYWFLFFSVGVFLGKGYLYGAGEEIPRLIILFTSVISCIGVISSRIILNNTAMFFIKKGVFSKKKLLLVIAKDTDYQAVVKDIQAARVYEIIGYTNREKQSSNTYPFIEVENIPQYIVKKEIDEIIYVSSDFDKKEVYKIWDMSRIFGVRYRYLTNSFDITKTQTSLSLIHTIPVVDMTYRGMGNWGRIFKRIFDIIFSLSALIILFPFLFVIYILIKSENWKAPAIYKNLRVGQGGKKFLLYKFRYMQWKYCVKDGYGLEEKNDEALAFEKELIKQKSSREGPLYKIQNDPRKTKIGAFIEKYSFDELPQLLNVLRGNMSLIGPRPHQPREVEKYNLRHNILLTVKPGITGMAQVNGREQNDFEQEYELDMFYIENWSFLLDVKIFAKTFIEILKR